MKLKPLIKELAAQLEERRKIDLIEKSSKSTIESILNDGNIEEPAAMRKLGDARLRLDLVPVRRRRVDSAIAKLMDSLKDAAQVASNAWAKFVQEKINAKMDELRIALEPFYPGEKRHLRSDMEKLHVPAIEEIRRAFHYNGFDENADAEFYVREGETLLKKITSACRSFGWQEPDNL